MHAATLEIRYRMLASWRQNMQGGMVWSPKRERCYIQRFPKRSMKVPSDFNSSI